ncbi:MAG: YlxR family protein [Polyangiaceae bacterium]|nr:YlxR family protein [Polyangiaceae bacterium]
MMFVVEPDPADPPSPLEAAAVGGGARSTSGRRRDRTCVGCRTATDPETVVRVVLGPDGSLAPDLACRAHGRGAWVHPRLTCLRDAARRGFARSFRSPVRTSAEELVELLRRAADRRIGGLLSGAWRARKLAVGSDAVVESLATGSSQLVIVARDARAAADTTAVSRAVADGLVRVWGTKSAIGLATGRAEVGIVAVYDAGFAQALSIALELAQMPALAAEPIMPPPGGSTEDG